MHVFSGSFLLYYFVKESPFLWHDFNTPWLFASTSQPSWRKQSHVGRCGENTKNGEQRVKTSETLKPTKWSTTMTMLKIELAMVNHSELQVCLRHRPGYCQDCHYDGLLQGLIEFPPVKVLMTLSEHPLDPVPSMPGFEFCFILLA